MRTYKVVLAGILLFAALAGAYIAFMFVYTENMFAPVTLLAAPQTQAPHTPGPEKYTRFIHKVNTPTRARQKDKRFEGFEVDIWMKEGQVVVAHDAAEAQREQPLTAIFEAVAQPAQKMWWLDLKQEISPEQLDNLLRITEQYQIATDHLLFEAVPGPTAQLIQTRGLNLLLQLPEGFNEDRGDASIRRQINEQALALWEQYKPMAVSASFGKYAYLREYFPNVPKAIYYSATVRPSIKKPLMAVRMQKDPSVKAFMTEEYTWLPF